MRHHTSCMRVLVTAITSMALLFFLATQPAAAQEAGEVAPPPHSIAPRPALEAPQAANYRLISIANTGQRLVAVGHHGNIVISEDGKRWQQVASPVNIMLTRVRFIDEKQGWITGYDGVILHTADGGNHWQVQHYDSAARPLYDILMLDAQHGIAVGGYGSYLTTTDGGNRWTQGESPLIELGLHFNMIQRLGDGTLFIAGEKSLLAWSGDNGKSWQLLNSPYNGTFFGAVPLGTRGVLVHGLRGHVYVSLDVTAAARQDPAKFDPANRVMIEDPGKVAAMGWQSLAGSINESMFGATHLPDGEVLLVGVNGLGQKTQLALATLKPIESTTDATLSDVLSWQGQLIGVGKRGVINLGRVD